MKTSRPMVVRDQLGWKESESLKLKTKAQTMLMNLLILKFMLVLVQREEVI
jgi:hypothetical protein